MKNLLWITSILSLGCNFIYGATSSASYIHKAACERLRDEALNSLRLRFTQEWQIYIEVYSQTATYISISFSEFNSLEEDYKRNTERIQKIDQYLLLAQQNLIFLNEKIKEFNNEEILNLLALTDLFFTEKANLEKLNDKFWEIRNMRFHYLEWVKTLQENLIDASSDDEYDQKGASRRQETGNRVQEKIELLEQTPEQVISQSPTQQTEPAEPLELIKLTSAKPKVKTVESKQVVFNRLVQPKIRGVQQAPDKGYSFKPSINRQSRKIVDKKNLLNQLTVWQRLSKAPATTPATEPRSGKSTSRSKETFNTFKPKINPPSKISKATVKSQNVFDRLSKPKTTPKTDKTEIKPSVKGVVLLSTNKRNLPKFGTGAQNQSPHLINH